MTDAAPFIPQMEPCFGDEEADALHAYMKEGGWITEFQRTAEFERQIAAYVGARHAVVVNNGTVSLTLAAIACGVVAGDEVIVPNYTMIATPNAVSLLGAKPVFVDVEPETLCMQHDAFEAAITPKTRAVMLVTANGRAPLTGIARFEATCKARGVTLIEDSAQSLGSRFPDGRHAGTAGVVGSFSFSAPKVISTGQGGALVTDDDAIAHKLRRLKDFGRAKGGTDVHDTIGYNFKFTELQACIGLEQMKKLPARVERKKEILRRYRQGLSGVRGVTLFAQELEHTTPWFIDGLFERRDALAAHLKTRGVGARVMYPPIHQQLAYADHPLAGASFPVSERVGREGLWLPSASQLTDAQIDRVTAAIREFY
jgi:perosamine synthetase